MSHIVPFTILPPDFKLEVTQTATGHLETAKMGHAHFTENVKLTASWTSILGVELSALFERTYHCDCVALSSLEPDGNVLVWVRSVDPYTKRLDAPAAPHRIEEPELEVEIIPPEARRLTDGIHAERTITDDAVIDI